MVMKGRRLAICLGTAVSAGGLLAANVVPAFASGGGGPVAQSVLGSGSDTTQFMMQGLDGLYMFSPGCDQLAPSGTTQWLDFSCLAPDPAGTVTTENYEHDQVHEAYFLGSSVGITQMCEQGQSGVARIDFARSSRAPKNGDCSGLHFVAYARDGLTAEAFDKSSSGIHNMNNQSGTCAGSTGFCLTQAQLQGIYITCSITNWSQVGGQNVKISIYTPQAGSGTRSTWDGFLGGDSSHCIPAAQQATHIIPENSNTPIKDPKNAIFPFSFGVWTLQVHSKNGARLAAVDNVAPSASSIGDGSFPYGRFLYNVFLPGTSSAATVNYVGEEGWICKPNADHHSNPVSGNNYRTDISNTISANGFVPVPNGVIGGGDSNSDFCRLFVSP
jgi:ABC-type phosphate transport system substrate-binding protein